MNTLPRLLMAAGAAALVAGTAYAEEWFPYAAQQIEPAFAADGQSVDIDYVALESAEQAWNICVSFPHLKDAYWLGVNYGVVEEARRLGVQAYVMDADGYTELSRQISQIEDCVSNGAQAVVIGAISFDGLNNLVTQLARNDIPVIDVINGIGSPDVAAKSLVSFYTMGQSTGQYLAEKHPAGSDEVVVGWFPGPAGAGWVEAANEGFFDAIEGSAVRVLSPKYGDTGMEVQLRLVEDELTANPDIRYVAGTAVTAEAAQGLIRERGLLGQVEILSFYITPGVYEGIQRGFILASPADSMVIQGRIAIDQAVRILEGREFVAHVGPKIFNVDASNIDTVPQDTILPPDNFRPVFTVP